MVDIAAREVREFHDLYYALLDDHRYEEWIALFTDPCLYRITTRENFGQGLPLSTVRCESQGMLKDRVAALNSTLTFAPRAYRRFSSALMVEPDEAGIKARSNVLVVQTEVDKPSAVGFCGVAYDTIRAAPDGLKLAERVCVLDTEMIPNSLIYPI